MTKIKTTCRYCGGENVMSDAHAADIAARAHRQARDASPEMLAALRALLMPQGNAIPYSEARDMGLRAIAKAEGRA